MKQALLFAALALISARAFSRQKEINFECGSVAAGKTDTHQMTYTTRARAAPQILVEVEATNIGTEKSPSCRVTWSVFRHDQDGKNTLLFKYSAEEARRYKDRSLTEHPSCRKPCLLARWHRHQA